MSTLIKGLIVVLLLALGFPGAASAARIFGRIRVDPNGSTVPKDRRVVIITPQRNYESKTGDNGTYSLSVSEVGPCRLVLYYPEGQAPSYAVEAADQPKEYNLRLKQLEGRWVLVPDRP